MKIGHLLLIGAAIYIFANKPSIPVNPIVIEPVDPLDPDIIDDPGTPIPGTLPGGNDVYKPDQTGELVYSHTEVYNPDGSISVYKWDGSQYLFYGTKQPKQLSANNGGAITGTKRKSFRRNPLI